MRPSFWRTPILAVSLIAVAGLMVPSAAQASLTAPEQPPTIDAVVDQHQAGKPEPVILAGKAKAEVKRKHNWTKKKVRKYKKKKKRRTIKKKARGSYSG